MGGLLAWGLQVVGYLRDQYYNRYESPSNFTGGDYRFGLHLLVPPAVFQTFPHTIEHIQLKLGTWLYYD